MNSAPQTDERLEQEAWENLGYGPRRRERFKRAVTQAIVTARAQGRADALAARGEAFSGEAPVTPSSAAAPATEDLERVAAALWRAWWRAHGESDAEIQFAQLYEGARARWIEIAKARFAARDEGSATR